MKRLSGDHLDRVLNEQIIINRLVKEAEDQVQLIDMIKAELWALGTLYQEGYYDIEMEEDVIEFEDKDYVAVGIVYEDVTDFLSQKNGKYIIPISYIEYGVYIVEYKIADI